MTARVLVSIFVVKRIFLLVVFLVLLDFIPRPLASRFSDSEPQELLFANINSKAENSGFHRNLSISICIKHCRLLRGYELLIKQTLPASVYVDPYETKYRKQIDSFGEPLLVIPSEVDVEQTAEKAKPFDVLIYFKDHVNCFHDQLNLNVHLPIHVRYHHPSQEGFVLFDIPAPTIFYRHRDDQQTMPNATTAPSASDPDWLLMISESALPLSVFVPVGFKQHAAVAVFVTLIVTLSGYTYLLVVIWQWKNCKVKLK